MSSVYIFEAFLSTLKELRELHSNNKKLAVLKRIGEDKDISPHFKKWLHYVYNPYFTYGIANVPDEAFDTDKAIEAWDNGDIACDDCDVLTDFFTLLDKLRTREITGNAAKKAIILFAYTHFEVYGICSVLQTTLDKTLDCGLSEKSINKVFDKLIPTFNIAKAEPFDNNLFINYPLIAEVKMNGVRAVAVVDLPNVTIYSSNGNPVSEDCLVTIKDEIRLLAETNNLNRFVLDGEITAQTRRAVSGVFNKALKGTLIATDEEKACLTFTIFDYLTLDCWEAQDPLLSEKQQDRTNFVQSFFAGSDVYFTLEPIHTRMVNSYEEIVKFNQSVLNMGGEGLVVKIPDSRYSFKRTADWQKIKNTSECDLKIVAFQDGTGRREDYFGAMVCESARGELRVAVGSGFSDAQLELFTKKQHRLIGKIATIAFNSVIQDKAGNYSLFLPRFIELRGDKFEADTLEKILKETPMTE